MARNLLAPSVGIVMLVAACNGSGAPGSEESDVGEAAAEIAEAFTSYREAMVSGDIELIVQHLTDDIRVAEPGLTLSGAAEFRSVVGEMLTAMSVVAYNSERGDIFVHGGEGYELGTYEQRYSVGGEESEWEGNYFIRWERGSDGRWRIDRYAAGGRNAPGEM